MPAMRSTAVVVALAAVALAGCQDAALRTLERRASASLIEAEAIAGNRSRFADELKKLRAHRAEVLASFEAVARPGGLEAAAAKAGATVVSDGPGDGRTVRFAGTFAPEQVLAILDRLAEARQPIRLDALRCDRLGCTGLLRAVPLSVGDAPAAAPTVAIPTAAELPRRPLWPPEADRWDRVQRDLDRLAARRVELGPLANVRDSNAELNALLDAIDVAKKGSALAVQAALDALAADSAEVTVTPFANAGDYGVQVVAPGASARLGALLSRRGAVVAEGGALRVTVELPAKAAVRKLLERATRR
jgi:hypothetical protein